MSRSAWYRQGRNVAFQRERALWRKQEIGHAMADTRLADLQAALDRAHDHLRRCEQELERWEEPQGGDHRGTLDRLRGDLRRAENDVVLLTNVLRAAEHAVQAFAD